MLSLFFNKKLYLYYIRDNLNILLIYLYLLKYKKRYDHFFKMAELFELLIV